MLLALKASLGRRGLSIPLVSRGGRSHQTLMSISANEQFFFDLNGFLIVRTVPLLMRLGHSPG